jgi:hypothetical protein
LEHQAMCLIGYWLSPIDSFRPLRDATRRTNFEK